MANATFNQFLFSYHKVPVELDCVFTVDNTAGAGVTGLQGRGIQAVWMHSGSASSSNPNPAVGNIVVQLSDSYKYYFASDYSIQAPLSGTNVAIDAVDANLTVGDVYVISALGTSTTADWVAVGVPAAITPAVGVSFVAAATGAGTGTGQVQVPTKSGISAIEVVGDPNVMVNYYASNGSYPQILLQTLAATNSSTTTLIPTAPAQGSIIQLKFLLSNSSVIINGS